MRLQVLSGFTYQIGSEVYSLEAGEHEVADELGEIALGAGWAIPAVKAERAPANKARKAAPENK